MPRVSKKETIEIGRKLKVNFDSISVETLQNGIKVELEHGKNKKTNVIGMNLTKAAKIALAHLSEFPNYYEELEKMEEKLKNQWKGKRKPRIFLS